MSTTTPESTYNGEQTPEQTRIAQLEAELAKARQANQPADDTERPWQLAADSVGDEHTREIAPLPYRGPGAVLHHFPMLTGGSGGNLNGPYVRALAELLAQAGYATNAVIRGEISHFDDSVMSDVARFKSEHDVTEPLAAYQGHARPAKEIAENIVGPYTIQALFEHVADTLEQPVEQLIARVEYDARQAVR